MYTFCVKMSINNIVKEWTIPRADSKSVVEDSFSLEIFDLIVAVLQKET